MGKFLQEIREELSLYVRHSAWLNAKVEVPTAQKIAGKTVPHSRLEDTRKVMKDEFFQPVMPPLELPHLVVYLWGAGPTIDTAFGPQPLSHLDIQAWRANSGLDAQPWEAEAMRELSREYLVQLNLAAKPDCPPPWLGGLPQRERRMAVANKVDAIFG